MNYAEILDTLNDASLFELYRLNVAIHSQLSDERRIRLIKNRLKIGQDVSYFLAGENRLIDATVVALKRTNVLVKHRLDGAQWNIPYYFVNTDNLDTDIQATPKRQLTKVNLKVGDNVCFKDREGNECFGVVYKLNKKTAGVLVNEMKWRVAYGLLTPVIDGELGENAALLEGEVLSRA
jgi:hypothetical protein